MGWAGPARGNHYRASGHERSAKQSSLESDRWLRYAISHAGLADISCPTGAGEQRRRCGAAVRTGTRAAVRLLENKCGDETASRVRYWRAQNYGSDGALADGSP